MNQPYRNATLGDLLRERRTTLGMSMRDVAGTALSPTAINNIEKGKIKPTIETVLYLCHVLELQPEQVLLFYPDFTKCAPALLDRVDELMQDKLLDEAVLLLYDMYWVATEQISCEDLIAEIQYKLAVVFDRLGRYEQARQVMAEAYKHFLAQKNTERQLNSLVLIGSFALHEQRVYRAIANLTEAVELAHRYQIENESTAHALTDLAEAHLLHGNFAEALSFNQEGEALYKRLQDTDAIARNALQQGRILAGLNETATAYQVVQHAFHHFERTENRLELSEAALVIGDILCLQENYDQAKSRFLHALQVRVTAPAGPTFPIEYRLSTLELRSGNVTAARSYARAALISATQPIDQSKVYQLLAQCDLQAHDLTGYRMHMNLASETLKSCGEVYGAALLECELADEINDMELLRSATKTLRQINTTCHCWQS